MTLLEISTRLTPETLIITTLVLLAGVGVGIIIGRGKTQPVEPVDDCLCNYENQPKDYMENDYVQNMISIYRGQHLDAINQRLGLNGNEDESDSYSVRFDLEKLKKFIYHTEKSAIKARVRINSETLGIRFYFATYPSDYDKTKYANRHTLVMVPTRKVGNDDMDFNFLDPALPTFFINNDYLANNMNNQSRISALNHGSLYPPMV